MSSRRRVGVIPAWPVALVLGGATIALQAMNENEGALPRQADRPPQVACAPDVPSVLAERIVRVRAWVTDETGKPIADDGLHFHWSTKVGQIEGRDVAAWTVGSKRELGEATVAVTWRSGKASCTVSVEIALPPVVAPGSSDRGGRLTGRSFLREGTLEAEGYGLYSYMLFATAPRNAEERERALQALQALLLVVQPVEALERYRRRSELNVTLVPVKTAIDIRNSLSDPAVVQAMAAQILDRYDYARGQELLSSLGIQDATGGPYLVSASKSEQARATQIVFDMRRAAPKLAWDWVTAFVRLAAQERSWTEQAMAKLALNTRNVLAVAAREAPEVLVALTDWVRVVRRP